MGNQTNMTLPASYMNSLGSSQIQDTSNIQVASDIQGKGTDTIGSMQKEGVPLDNSIQETNMTSKIKAAEMTTDPDGNIIP